MREKRDDGKIKGSDKKRGGENERKSKEEVTEREVK